MTDDDAVIKPYQRYLLGLISSLKPLLETIKGCDTEITAIFEQHEDRAIFASFPGTGDILAPRLLAAFGSDRSRFSSADEVNKCVGIAPVVERSGKKSWVHWRFKCPKFLRQTFIAWAKNNLSIPFGPKPFMTKNGYRESHIKRP